MNKRSIWGPIAGLFAAGLLLMAGGCENSLTSVLQAIEDRVFGLGTPDTYPDNGTAITSYEDIKIVFADTIDTSSISFGGTMGDLVEELGWGTTNFPDDTLYIRPKTPENYWPSGDDQTLTISCVNVPDPGEDLKGLTNFELRWNIFTGVCVDVQNGSDTAVSSGPYFWTAQGTAEFPMKSIGAGIAQALLEYPVSSCEVRIGGYTTPWFYNINSSSGGSITLTPGISLTGSFNPDNWLVSDPSLFNTLIVDDGTSGTCAAISGTDSSIDNATVISNLSIQVGAGNIVYGIFLNSAAPTIRNVSVRGDAGPATSTVTGIYTQGNGPSIEDCEVLVNWDGTDYPNTSVGVHFGSASTTNKSSITGSSTVVSGGKGNDTTIGITVSENGSTISGITVDGGSMGTSGNVSAIYCEDAGATITGNTIDASKTSGHNYAAGIRIYNLGSMTFYPRISGNTFRNTGQQTPVFGIMEFQNPVLTTFSDPYSVTNNTFSQRYRTLTINDGYYLDEGTGSPPSGTLIRDLDNTVTIYDNSTINLDTEGNVEQVFP